MSGLETGKLGETGETREASQLDQRTADTAGQMDPGRENTNEKDTNMLKDLTREEKTKTETEHGVQEKKRKCLISKHLTGLISSIVIYHANKKQKLLDSGSIVSSYFQTFRFEGEMTTQSDDQQFGIGTSATSGNGGIELRYDAYKLNLFIVNNDIDEEENEQNLVWLVSIKEIFSKQLPKMPKEYIIRLCFDKDHYTLLCVKTDLETKRKEVIGGVCFKPFLDQRFIEIVFLAVSSNHQVSGFGTILMNHLKHYIQTIDTTDKDWKRNIRRHKETHDYTSKDGNTAVSRASKVVEDPPTETAPLVSDTKLDEPLSASKKSVINTRSKFLKSARNKPPRFTYITHFLTYADNLAIGYFQKQGFTKEITIPLYRYNGYIKDYDGGTLMECQINPYINYLNIKELIQEQKRFLMNKMKETYKTQPTYPGLSSMRAMKETKDITSIFDIPGVREAGWTEAFFTKMMNTNPGLNFRLKLGNEKLAAMHEMLNEVLQKVKKHDDAWCFLEPVPDTVIDYIDIVKDPIDLSLIQSRLDSGNHYRVISDLQRDLKKMCDNCRLYNEESTDYYHSADKLQQFFDPLIAQAEEDFKDRFRPPSPEKPQSTRTIAV